MTALTTTQRFFDEHNMVQGSLSFVTVELKNASHKYWEGTVAAGSALVVGTEYTITTVGAASWAALGGPAAGEGEVGDKFTVTTAGNVPTGGAVSYGDNHAALQKIIQNVSSRASIVYIGKANHADYAGLGKINLMIENAGYQNDEGMDHDRVGEDSGDYTSGHAGTLQKYLRLQEHGDATNDTVWAVTKMNF